MTFLYPYVLLALLLPALLAVGIILTHRRAGAAWRRLVSPAHPELVQQRAHWQIVIPPVLALLALSGLIIAAARPINGYGSSEATATGRNLLIALDISRSMETQDVAPSRLEEARAAAYELIEALPGDKIGLIVFSGEADVVVPLTYDHTALRDALEQVNRDWAGYGGTNFGLLLRAAMQTFARSAPDGANALIILSDGEDTVDSSLQIAEEARKNNLLVITVGIGTPAGGAIPDPQGENGLWQDASGRHVISKLDIQSLQRFAEATGGDFVAMSSGADLTAFAREAAHKLAMHEETLDVGRVPLDLFSWFAVPSLLALLAAIMLSTEWRAWRGRRGAMLAGLLLLLSQAQAAPPEQAYREGLQALQRNEKQAAQEQLSAALLSNDTALQAAAHLALGNMNTRTTFDKLRSLYGQGEEADSSNSAAAPSIEALQGIVDELRKNLIPYRDALAADASLAAAQQNISALEELIRKIEEEIERLKQQQQNDQQQQDSDQNKDDQQQQDGDQNKDNQQQQDGDQNKDDQQQQDGDQNKDDQKQQDGDQNKDDQQQQDGDQNKDDQQQQDGDQNKDDQKQQDGDQNKDDQKQQDGDQNKDDQKQQDGDQNKDDQQQQNGDQNKDNQQQQDGDQNKDDRQQQNGGTPQQQQDSGQQGSDQQQEQAAAAQAQDMQEAELSQEEKDKQRAAGILRMHLDEEKGSPIPHFNNAVRPPSKDY